MRARWTISDLDALAARISTRMGQPVAGLPLIAVGMDVVNNRVLVMVAGVNQAVREELAAEYPADMICLEQGTMHLLAN